ncbi:hypothetical protein LXA43DRAFT_451533 [Ganoderma leucocontextum]|nr:hypothetical protein LXA43DRAFT_451533 [Ganoderma leucocontextum]
MAALRSSSAGGRGCARGRGIHDPLRVVIVTKNGHRQGDAVAQKLIFGRHQRPLPGQCLQHRRDHERPPRPRCRQGSLLYLGVSNMHAWMAVKANECACYLPRRDLLHARRAEPGGPPFSVSCHVPPPRPRRRVVAAGHLHTDEVENTAAPPGTAAAASRSGKSGTARREAYGVVGLECTAKKVWAEQKQTTAVAIAYVMYVFPIIGGQNLKAEWFEGGERALDRDEHIKAIEAVTSLYTTWLSPDRSGQCLIGFVSTLFSETGHRS